MCKSRDCFDKPIGGTIFYYGDSFDANCCILFLSNSDNFLEVRLFNLNNDLLVLSLYVIEKQRFPQWARSYFLKGLSFLERQKLCNWLYTAVFYSFLKKQGFSVMSLMQINNDYLLVLSCLPEYYFSIETTQINNSTVHRNIKICFYCRYESMRNNSSHWKTPFDAPFVRQYAN